MRIHSEGSTKDVHPLEKLGLLIRATVIRGTGFGPSHVCTQAQNHNTESRVYSIMGIFDNIENVEAAGGTSVYFADGTYKFKVSKFTQGVSKRGKGPFCAIEGEIIEVKTGFEGSNKVGQIVSQVIMLNAGDIALKDVKAFVAAAAKRPASDVTAAICEKASADAGTLLAGAEVTATATTITTKAGNPFTKVSWSMA